MQTESTTPSKTDGGNISPDDTTPNAAPEKPKPTPKPDYVLERYEERIQYYWKASRHNKTAYRVTRYLTIVFGALVTLIASLSSATFIADSTWSTVFAIMTPLLAAILAIIGGFAQTFHWGAAWQEMVLTATQLEKMRDRLRVLPPDQRDPAQEIDALNDIVIEETQGFFQRILGAQKSKQA